MRIAAECTRQLQVSTMFDRRADLKLIRRCKLGEEAAFQAVLDRYRAALDGRFSPMLGKAERFGRADIESRGPVGMFNIESVSELERLEKIASELGVRARACLLAGTS